MSHSITKLQRWLDLIAYLIGRRQPVTVEELMERIPAYAARWVDGTDRDRASVRRTFERDKDELRRLGIPIDTTTYQINYGLETIEGYTLRRRDFYLPYLKLAREAGTTSTPAEPRPYPLAEVELREEEALAALDALRVVAELPASPLAEEARSAFRKLAFDLDPESFSTNAIVHVDRPDAAEVRELLRPLSTALLNRKTVTFIYHAIYRDEVSQREVHPYGLFFQNGNWYLAAHDLGRDERRLFRVGRISDLTVNTRSPNTPDYEIPHDFDVEEYLQRQPWELGDDAPLTARVLFPFPLSLWAERNQYGTLVEERDDGATIREFHLRQPHNFLRWLLSLEGEATIIEPTELRAELRRLARDVVDLYRTDRTTEP